MTVCDPVACRTDEMPCSGKAALLVKEARIHVQAGRAFEEASSPLLSDGQITDASAGTVQGWTPVGVQGLYGVLALHPVRSAMRRIGVILAPYFWHLWPAESSWHVLYPQTFGRPASPCPRGHTRWV